MTVQSKITAQNQISVPAEIRKRLGVGPGSLVEWEERDGEVVMRRAGRYSSADIHAALFPNGVPKPKFKTVKEGIAEYVRQRHARGRY